MRDYIIARIAVLRNPNFGFLDVHYLFANERGKRTGYSDPIYKFDEDFSTYSDENLIQAFERIVRESGKQHG